MKRRKKSKPKNVRRARGRPSRAEEEQYLEEDAWLIEQEFSLRPLRSPVDEQFDPYYRRIREGDLLVVGEYCDANSGQLELDASFYELLGRLVAVCSHPVVRWLLSNIKRRSVFSLPSNREAYQYWESRLLPLAKSAKQWIRGYLANNVLPWRRGRAWCEYAETMTRPDPPDYCDLARHRAITHVENEPLYMGHYVNLSIAPRELFMLLAENQGKRYRPSHAVRKYLQDVRHLSYSNPSRKACAQK